MKKTLYMKYGSRVTSGMAECLYDRLLDDPDLAPFFDGVDIENLREAHAGYTISRDHFERLMDHIAAAGEELAIEAEDIATIAAAIRSYEADVVTG